MSVYLTGDTHGRVIERFSYEKNPEMKSLTENDVMIILGDFGVIWGKEQNPEEEYTLNWLNEKPWTTIAIGGNHENWDRWLSFQIEEKWGGKVRNIGYEKVWLVADPTILDIQGKHILVMPGAESHDIYPVNACGDFFNLGTGYSNLVDPALDPLGEKRKKMRNQGLFYRVIGESWWPQEKINIEACLDLLEGREEEYFDLILTHEAPSGINEWFGGGNYNSNEEQHYFDLLAKTLNYNKWYHGHFHIDRMWPTVADSDYIYVPYESKMRGLYFDVVKE